MEAPELRQGAVPRQLPARPDPPAAAARRRTRSRRARRSSPTLRAFLDEQGRPARRSSATPRSPTTSSRGSRSIGALGMKIPTEYGGLGLSQVYYNKALALAGVWHSSLSTLLSAHQSIGVAEPLRAVRLRGAEAEVAAARSRKDAHLGVPAHRARRRLRPRAPRHRPRCRPRTAGLPHQRPQAVGDQRRDRRRRRRHGPGPEGRGPPRRHQRLHRSPTTPTASPSSTATSSWACAASRTR